MLAAIKEIVECCSYVLPAIERNTVRLIYDDSMESRALTVDGANVDAEVNSIADKKSLRLWFVYTRNRSRRATSPQRETSVKCPQILGEPLTGDIREDWRQRNAKWLSFRGTSVCDCANLSVSSIGFSTATVENVSSIASFRKWWPIYKRSPKHRKNGYRKKGGEWVSPMGLDSDTAQKALIGSVEFNGARFAQHESKYYEFRRTHPDRDIFHGFEVTPIEVPQDVVDLLREHP